MAKRRKFTDQFKAQVALEALRGDKKRKESRSRHRSVEYDPAVRPNAAHLKTPFGKVNRQNANLVDMYGLAGHLL